MDKERFELKPKYKGMLASMLQETGQPAPTLAAAITAVLEEMAVHPRPGDVEARMTPAANATPPQEGRKPIWEQFAEAFDDVPDEELARLPTDLAAQVDHYIYGLPKR